MRKATIAVVFFAVFGLLASLTYVNFGTAFGFQTNVLLYTTSALVFGALLSTWFLNWNQRIGAVAVMLGLVLFAYAITGGGYGCNDARYPPEAEHGITYDWTTNTLKFGDNIHGTSYRCTAHPVRAGVLLSHGLVSGGLLSILRNRGFFS